MAVSHVSHVPAASKPGVLRADIRTSRWVSGVLLYGVEVEDNGCRWTMEKRYSDFKRLDRDLRASSALSRLALPQKGLFGIRHQLDVGWFNAQRHTGLAAYIRHLTAQVTSVQEDPALAAFLGQAPGVMTVVSAPAGGIGGGSASAATAPTLKKGAASQTSTPVSATPPPPRRHPGRRALGPPPTDEEWAALQCEEPGLVDALRNCVDLATNPGRFDNKCEDAFQPLRRSLRACRREGAAHAALSTAPGKAQVWEFLSMVHARRRFLRDQVEELEAILETSAEWVAAKPPPA